MWQCQTRNKIRILLCNKAVMTHWHMSFLLRKGQFWHNWKHTMSTIYFKCVGLIWAPATLVEFETFFPLFTQTWMKHSLTLAVVQISLLTKRRKTLKLRSPVQAPSNESKLTCSCHLCQRYSCGRPDYCTVHVTVCSLGFLLRADSQSTRKIFSQEATNSHPTISGAATLPCICWTPEKKIGCNLQPW